MENPLLLPSSLPLPWSAKVPFCQPSLLPPADFPASSSVGPLVSFLCVCTPPSPPPPPPEPRERKNVQYLEKKEEGRERISEGEDRTNEEWGGEEPSPPPPVLLLLSFVRWGNLADTHLRSPPLPPTTRILLFRRNYVHTYCSSSSSSSVRSASGAGLQRGGERERPTDLHL